MEKRSCDSEAGSLLLSKKKVYSISEMLKIFREVSSRKRGPPSDLDAADPCSKRQKVETGFVYLNCSANEGFLGSHQNVIKVSNFGCGASKSVKVEKVLTEKKYGKPIDSCKKLQCSIILRRMMISPDGKDFQDFVHTKASSLRVPEIESKKPMDLMALKSKLDKDLYFGTQEFAADVRRMFSDVMLYNNPIYNIAKRLLDDFEMRWNSLNKNWATENDSNKRGNCQKLPPLPSQNLVTKTSDSEPSRKFKKGTVVANVAGSQNHVPVQVHEKKKTQRENCGAFKDSSCSDATKLSSSKVTCTAKPMEHFLDTILKSQQSLFDFGCKADLLRRKQREAERVALGKMERQVYIDDNLKAFEELELLCGHSLTYCTTDHSLESLGLFLKDEPMTHWDEDVLLQGDWEEGEIMF